MIYFSEIRGKKVYTTDKILVGKLDDIIFATERFPKLTKLVIRAKNKELLVIPISCLVAINSDIVIEKNYNIVEIAYNEIYILRNVLDKQIIDLSGDKIVRANDVVIQDKPEFYVAGVDIGFLGVFRRLKLENIVIRLFSLLRIKLLPIFLSWTEVQPLELGRGHIKLTEKESKIKQLKPQDLAFYLNETNIWNTRKIINTLDEKTAAEVISRLNLNYQVSVLKLFPIDKTVRIINIMDPDEAVDILLDMSPKRREKIISELDGKRRKEINHLRNLSNTSLGKFISLEYITVTSNLTIKEVIEKIRKETVDFFALNYIYVVNNENELVGVFSLHELLMRDPEVPVYRFMVQDVVIVHSSTTEELALRKMFKYKLNCVPVIDDNKHILGIVNFDDIGHELINKNW